MTLLVTCANWARPTPMNGVRQRIGHPGAPARTSAAAAATFSPARSTLARTRIAVDLRVARIAVEHATDIVLRAVTHKQDMSKPRICMHLQHRPGRRLHVMRSRMVRHGLLTNPSRPRWEGGPFGPGTLAYPAPAVASLFWSPLILIAIGALAAYYLFEQTRILPTADRAMRR